MRKNTEGEIRPLGLTAGLPGMSDPQTNRLDPLDQEKPEYRALAVLRFPRADPGMPRDTRKGWPDRDINGRKVYGDPPHRKERGGRQRLYRD
jgi:hypothetical protein